MKLLFASVVFVHGLIHLMAPAKAFGLVELSQLREPISKAMGLCGWLLRSFQSADELQFGEP